MFLTQRDVSEIQQLLESSGHNELRVETPLQNLLLRRSPGGGWIQELSARAPATAPDAAAEATSSGSRPAQGAGISRDGIASIRSPLPGTFYRAPKPGAPPFVEVGSKLSEHTVIGIVEMMKLMNSVPAGISGEVVEICAANGQVVESGEVLVRVRAGGDAP